MIRLKELKKYIILNAEYRSKYTSSIKVPIKIIVRGITIDIIYLNIWLDGTSSENTATFYRRNECISDINAFFGECISKHFTTHFRSIKI